MQTLASFHASACQGAPQAEPDQDRCGCTASARSNRVRKERVRRPAAFPVHSAQDSLSVSLRMLP
eukprot:8331920-Pyramimonas_sp.AAC.1